MTFARMSVATFSVHSRESGNPELFQTSHQEDLGPRFRGDERKR